MGIADLGERNSRDEEVSPDMESKESENEGSDEKSGVHRMNTFWALWTREGGGRDEAFRAGAQWKRR